VTTDLLHRCGAALHSVHFLHTLLLFSLDQKADLVCQIQTDFLHLRLEYRPALGQSLSVAFLSVKRVASLQLVSLTLVHVLHPLLRVTEGSGGTITGLHAVRLFERIFKEFRKRTLSLIIITARYICRKIFSVDTG